MRSGLGSYVALMFLVLAVGPAGLKAQATTGALVATEPASVVEAAPVESVRDRRIVLAAGLAVPGLGHFYTGRRVVGGVLFGAAAGAVLYGVLSERETRWCAGPAVGLDCFGGRVHRLESERNRLGTGLLLAGVVTAASAIHAWMTTPSVSGGSVAQQSEPAGLTLGAPSVNWDGSRVQVGLFRLNF